MTGRKKVAGVLPCIVCEKALTSIGSGSTNHADNANAFRTLGQYGSTAFDPIDGSSLEVNICDDCLLKATKKHQVLLHEPAREEAQIRQKFRYWDGHG